jgi:hypothetical protein
MPLPEGSAEGNPTEPHHKASYLVPCQARSLPAAGSYGKADLKLVASDCDLSSSVSSLASTSAFRQTTRRITCTQEADSQLTEKYPCLCVLLLHCEHWPAIAFFAMVRSSFHRDRLQGWSSHNGATLTMNFIPQDRKCKQNFILLVFVDDCGLMCQKLQLKIQGFFAFKPVPTAQQIC